MPNPILARSLPEVVVAIAKRFVGQKETGKNAGFANVDFQREMQKSGWERGMPWCALLSETIYRIATEEERRPQLWANLEPLFSASAVETLQRFARKGYTIKQTPVPGDLVVWRFGPGPSGHTGIVVSVDKGTNFTTVEGNTSNNTGGIIREGEGVFLKHRRYGGVTSKAKDAFNLLGFISVVS